MRWKPKRHKYGDIRVRRKFCLFPYTMGASKDGERVWLEYVWVKEEFRCDEWWWVADSYEEFRDVIPSDHIQCQLRGTTTELRNGGGGSTPRRNPFTQS